MRPFITFALTAVLAITLTSCSNPKVSDLDWMQELELKSLQLKSPYLDNPDILRVYFQFDTIVEDYKVSGVFYPTSDDDAKNYYGGVSMYLRNVVTGREYELTNYDHKSHKFTSYFMSNNLYDIIKDSTFNGFKNGDSYVFTYHNEHDTMRWKGYDESEIFPLKSHVEFQFYDVDFDGRDELLICCCREVSYQHPMFEVYELNKQGLKKRDLTINSLTRFDQKRMTVFTMEPNEKLRLTSYYEYEGNGNGNLNLRWHATDPWKSDSVTSIPDKNTTTK